MPGEPKTSQRRIAAKEKQAAALEMRKAGLTYDAIAAKLGYTNKTSAYKAVMTALNDLRREPAEEVRILELERLDTLWAKLWDRVVMPGSLRLSDLGQIITYALKLSERRAKLLGLDQPLKIEVADWRHELEEAGLSPGEEFEQLVNRFVSIATSAGSDDAGSVDGGEEKAKPSARGSTKTKTNSA